MESRKPTCMHDDEEGEAVFRLLWMCICRRSYSQMQACLSHPTSLCLPARSTAMWGSLRSLTLSINQPD